VTKPPDPICLSFKTRSQEQEIDAADVRRRVTSQGPRLDRLQQAAEGGRSLNMPQSFQQRLEHANFVLRQQAGSSDLFMMHKHLEEPLGELAPLDRVNARRNGAERSPLERCSEDLGPSAHGSSRELGKTIY
jgi:hypothetical protein